MSSKIHCLRTVTSSTMEVLYLEPESLPCFRICVFASPPPPPYYNSHRRSTYFSLTDTDSRNEATLADCVSQRSHAAKYCFLRWLKEKKDERNDIYVSIRVRNSIVIDPMNLKRSALVFSYFFNKFDYKRLGEEAICSLHSLRSRLRCFPSGDLRYKARLIRHKPYIFTAAVSGLFGNDAARYTYE